MKIAIATLKSISPYSQSRKHNAPKLDKESHEAYDKRTWREKCTYDDKGIIHIPQMAFKFCLDRAAAMLGLKVKEKGQSTWKKHFVSGVLVLESMSTGIHKDKVASQTLSVHANGQRGSGKRVDRTFPLIPEWSGKVTFHILDDTITEEIFEQHLREAGNLVGVGRFRPENGGYYGRFAVVKIEWREA